MMGTSYSEIVAAIRLEMACRLLTETNEHISRIALSLGYAGASSFSRTFMRRMKVQPGIFSQAAREPPDHCQSPSVIPPARIGAKWQDMSDYLARNGQGKTSYDCSAALCAAVGLAQGG